MNTAAKPISGSAFFLDRDGVINVDRGYVHRPDQFEFVPGIFPLARFWAYELRRAIVVVSNQSGIGRGYFDEKGLCVIALKRKARQSFARAGKFQAGFKSFGAISVECHQCPIVAPGMA